MTGTIEGCPHPDTFRKRRSEACWLAALALLLSLICSGRAGAADRWTDLVETVFQNYGREQGLPHPVPIALAQDGDGFLWIGTQGGLARWDGYRFRDYPQDAGDPNGLPDTWIHTLHTDPRGRLWIGTGSGGLARYDRDRDRLAAVPLPTGPGRKLVGAIADDPAGGLWVGMGDGLYHLDPDTGAVTALRHDARNPGSLPEGQVQAIVPDRAGRLWIGTAAGLVRRDAGSDRFTPVPLAPTAGSSATATIAITALFEADDGRIWIGTSRHGAYVVDPVGGAPRPVAETGPAGSTLQSNSISAIGAANPQELWIGTRGFGIVVVDTVTGRTRRILHDRALPGSLAHDDVYALMRDRTGSMWVGGTGGLSYHARDLGAVSTVFGASSRANGVSAADVYAILPTRDGRLWLGFLSGGVDVLDPIAGRVAQLLPDPTHPDSALPKDFVTALAEDDRNHVFVGTVQGPYRVDEASRAVSLAAVPQRDPHSSVYALAVDAGVLWVGGLDDGLWGMRLDGTGELVFGPAESKGLTDQNVDSILHGTGQDLWVGTRNGLNRVDLATHAIEQILPDLADPTALPVSFVSSTVIDRQGRLWVGTFGGGIAVMTGRGPTGKPQFHRLGLAEGLPHLNVDTLLMDAQGRVWAGTDDGLAVIDPTSFAIRALHRAEGSVLADYFENSGAVDLAGEPLFGAKGGLTIVQAERLQTWDYHPPIVVSDVRVGGSAVPSGRFNGAGSTRPLVLTPETNGLAVEFAALDFTAPERNRYAYRLDGYDRDWVETDATRRLAAYTNLPPGDYTLRLRGSNRDGAWTERNLDIPIQVLPAWYQTPWFRIAATLAGLAMIAALVRSRTAYLRARQAELERQVADRTADLRAANERLFDQATIDPLTTCANRRHFVERAHELIELSRRARSPITLMIIDLDEFKRVNDIYGHPAGDEVLRMIGRIGRGLVRTTDLLGRIGGEEFALLMPNAAVEGAAHFAERLREAVSLEEAHVEGTILRITISLGLAELRSGESFDALYARADAALYAAKESGRNRVVVDADGD
ncbi:MAG TPA: two-component regulator propeller domain-containing protein [Aliidongia sp.]|uniref:ligand-binding sensor domain-containing protein n=1 Tax=Aliidongia sp. TaxID=1914230 RepID=UPI002DDD7E28|nr:two-component regulator propeller domain-containing protein [Aliidongia sp.]HEV2675989.1 two-component regulator propeller domain-containing protein [Aliidongia sp.]